MLNVRGQGTRHLVEGTLDPIVGIYHFGFRSWPQHGICKARLGENGRNFTWPNKLSRSVGHDHQYAPPSIWSYVAKSIGMRIGEVLDV